MWNTNSNACVLKEIQHIFLNNVLNELMSDTGHILYYIILYYIILYDIIKCYTFNAKQYHSVKIYFILF